MSEKHFMPLACTAVGMAASGSQSRFCSAEVPEHFLRARPVQGLQAQQGGLLGFRPWRSGTETQLSIRVLNVDFLLSKGETNAPESRCSERCVSVCSGSLLFPDGLALTEVIMTTALFLSFPTGRS